jgi:hypothetical protein
MQSGARRLRGDTATISSAWDPGERRAHKTRAGSLPKITACGTGMKGRGTDSDSRLEAPFARVIRLSP